MKKWRASATSLFNPVMKIEEEIRQQKFRDSYQKVAINLLFTAGWLEGKQQEFFKPYGVTPQQFNILRILRGQHPKSISGVDIKSRMLDKNSDVSRMLDRLAKKLLITKSQCPDDKRATNVQITIPGLELLKTIDRKLEQTEKTSLALSEEEALQLSNLLDKSRG